MKKKHLIKNPVARRFFRRPTSVIGCLILLAFLLIALLGPFIIDSDPNANDLNNTWALPGAGHLLGTDNLGRDTLTRMIYGAHYSVGKLCRGSHRFICGHTAGSHSGLFRRQGGRDTGEIHRYPPGFPRTIACNTYNCCAGYEPCEYHNSHINLLDTFHGEKDPQYGNKHKE